MTRAPLVRRPGTDEGTVFRCGVAARWLPRVLAATALLAGFLASERLELAGGTRLASGVRAIVVVSGALLGLWILKVGAEVRLRLTVTARRVLFDYGGRSGAVELAELERFDYEAPFGASRRLFPAAVLLDRDGLAWRIPVILEGGERALEQIIDHAGREDLATWAESLGLRRKLSRTGAVVAIGYLVAGLLLAAGAWLGLR